MKLGSIVGIVLSCALIIAGIVMCFVGVSSAKNDGQYLFTQSGDGGTYYSQKIDEGTTRLKIEYENADITIVGGAEKSQIEFNNFNPNYYSLSATPNVITFEETQELDSIVDIWENGINFKGLRYALDFKNLGYDSNDKSIVISLSSDSNIKIIDVSAATGNVKIENLTLDGDISLNVKSGDITIDKVNTTSTIEIFGDSVNASVTDTSALSFRHSVKSSNIKVDSCTFADAQITVESGRVDYYAAESLDGAYLSVTSETGGLLINSLPHNGPLFSEPEEYEKSLKIKCVSAGINLEYPDGTDTSETADTEASE